MANMPMTLFNEFYTNTYGAREMPLKIRDQIEFAYLAGMMKGINEYAVPIQNGLWASDEDDEEKNLEAIPQAIEQIETRWQQQGHI